MIRWIAFDDETAEAVVSRFKRGAAEIRQGQPLDAALTHDRPSLLVLPSSTPGKVLLARFEPKRPKPNPENASDPSLASESAAYEATGFLGLIDQPVFTRRPQPAQDNKQKWWQRRSA